MRGSAQDEEAAEVQDCRRAGNRTIVSGIAQHYKPEELVGKQVLFIANLAPRQFKNGLVSEGMILSAENYDGSLAVTSLLKEVKPGSEVK